MKARILVIFALPFALVGCSSFRAPPATAQATRREPIRAENHTTVWGEMPGYGTAGHHFILPRDRRPRPPTEGGVAVVDVLVEADGSVTDAAIFESSGRAEVDQYALRLYRSSRYSLQLRPGDPAPHVVRQQFILRVDEPRLRLDATNYQSLGPNVTAPAFPGRD